MFRRTRCSRTGRVVAILVTITLPWLCGPAQLGEAATAEARPKAAREAGQGRPLSLAEQRAIRGSATWPGTPRSWQFDHATLGGYGRVNCLSGNHHLAIPLVGWTGKGGGLQFGRITVENQPGDHTTTYTLDEIYQLTREQRTGTLPYDHLFSYDATGNRLTKTTGAGTETCTYGDNDQILTAGGKTYAHDNDGNMTGVTVGGQTTSLQWDYNNKLKQITYPAGATNTFQTNDAGQRVSKTDSGGTTTSLFDSEEAPWAVLADSRAAALKGARTRGGVTGLISERQGSTSRFYHADQLASTRGLTSTSQTITDTREFDAWGLLVTSTGSTATPFGFAGGHGYQRDADSGLMLLGKRYYDASIGRFISRDPIGHQGGLNLYGYCGNDPVSLADPEGCAAPLAVYYVGVGAMFITTYILLQLAIRNYFENTHARAQAQYWTAGQIMESRRHGQGPTPTERPAGPLPVDLVRRSGHRQAGAAVGSQRQCWLLDQSP